MTCDGILGNDCPRFWEAAIMMYYIFQEISLLIPHISFGITCTLVEHFVQLLNELTACTAPVIQRPPLTMEENEKLRLQYKAERQKKVLQSSQDDGPRA